MRLFRRTDIRLAARITGPRRMGPRLRDAITGPGRTVVSGVEFCPSCGSPRWADAQFCGSCGLDIAEWERQFHATGTDLAVPEEGHAERDDTPAAQTEAASIAGGPDRAGHAEEQPGLDDRPGPLRDAAPADEARVPHAGDELALGAPSWMAVGAELSRDAPGSSADPTTRTAIVAPVPEVVPAPTQPPAPLQRGTSATSRTPAGGTARPGSRRRGTTAFGIALVLVGVLVAGAAGLGAFAVLGGFASPSPSTIASSPGAAAASGSTAPATAKPSGSSPVAASPSATGAETPVPASAPASPGASAVPAAPGWSLAGSLAQPRWGAVAATIPNGDVLVAGGTGGVTSSAAVSLAEVYHAATAQWQVVAPMNERRSLSQAVTLANGLVLVFGGSRDGVPLASAELFDPQSGTWTKTAPMTVARTDFAAVRLADGQVMAIGGGTGKSAASVTATVEIFNPDTKTWARTASTASPRAYATAVVLGDGSVLVAGGRSTYYGSGGTVWATAERWDPNGRTWNPAASMSGPRYFGAAAALRDGSAVVAGGWPDTGNTRASSSVDVYDLASSSWQSAGPMASSRAAFAMLALADGRLLVVGGQTEGTNAPSTASAELFDPGSRTWSGAGSLATPVWYPAAGALPGGRALVAGGAVTADGSTSTAAAEVFTPPHQ